jgi:large subunit ribosomal protein L13
VKFTGKKLTTRSTIGTPVTRAASSRTHRRQDARRTLPGAVLEKAVERMLPKESPLARKQLTHLRIYTTAEHPHQAQNPETIAFAANAKNVRSA